MSPRLTREDNLAAILRWREYSYTSWLIVTQNGESLVADRDARGSEVLLVPFEQDPSWTVDRLERALAVRKAHIVRRRGVAISAAKQRAAA